MIKCDICNKKEYKYVVESMNFSLPFCDECYDYYFGVIIDKETTDISMSVCYLCLDITTEYVFLCSAYEYEYISYCKSCFKEECTEQLILQKLGLIK